MAEDEAQDEIKKRILSKIEKLEEISNKSNQPMPDDNWQRSDESTHDEFFKSPLWQDHLVNINKLWNIYSEDGTVRTGILHEINEGWALNQFLESDVYKELNQLMKGFK